jgi:N,N'-diacetyllegionaminate synthase
LSTPFDFESADFLNSLVPIFKISSGDCTNIPFLKKISAFGKPMILSTGMAEMDEIGAAVSAISAPLTLLHCTTQYPCPVSEVNLAAMKTLREAFGVPVGYSDHTQGIPIALAAAALGATVIEKHFTLDKNLSGPDHKASLGPDELRQMVSAIRDIEIAMGDGKKTLSGSEKINAAAARKSLLSERALPKGHRLSEEDIGIKRPGDGIAPKFFDAVVGKTLARAIDAEHVLQWDDLA